MAVQVTWLQFNTGDTPVDVRVSWLAFDTAGTIPATGQVYGGKKRRAPGAGVDDLTIDHVRKHWELIEQQEQAAAAAAQAIAEASKPAKVAIAKPAAVVVPKPAPVPAPPAPVVMATAEQVAMQRAEIDASIKRVRQAAEDALILSLFNA